MRIDRALAGCALPPLAADAVKFALQEAGEVEDEAETVTLLAGIESAKGLTAKHQLLADLLMLRGKLAVENGSRFGLNACALATGVLAVAGELRSPGEQVPPCEKAVEGVSWFLGEGDKPAAALLARVRAILGEVRDAVALEAGRAAFVRAVRKQLVRVGCLRSHVLDVVHGRLKLGGRVLRYRRRRRHGEGATEDSFRVLSTRNQEGRLVLLVADRRSPRLLGDGHLVSRARAALKHASGGNVVLEGEPLELRPRVELSERAREIVRSIKFLQRDE